MSRARKVFLTEDLKGAVAGAQERAQLQVQAQEQERAQLAAVDQKPHRSTQLRSSVGAQPSSAAPIDPKP
jgi:hypothetical protein